MAENLIVGALVVASLVYVVARARRAFKSGGCGCGCDCGRERRDERQAGGCGCDCGNGCVGRRGCERERGEKPESSGGGRSR